MFGGRSQELPSGLCQQVPSHHRPLVSQQLSQCPAKVLWTSGFHVWHLLPSYTDPSSTTGILDQLCLWSCQSRWAGFNTVIFFPWFDLKVEKYFWGKFTKPICHHFKVSFFSGNEAMNISENRRYMLSSPFMIYHFEFIRNSWSISINDHQHSHYSSVLISYSMLFSSFVISYQQLSSW